MLIIRTRKALKWFASSKNENCKREIYFKISRWGRNRKLLFSLPYFFIFCTGSLLMSLSMIHFRYRVELQLRFVKIVLFMMIYWVIWSNTVCSLIHNVNHMSSLQRNNYKKGPAFIFCTTYHTKKRKWRSANTKHRWW